MRSCRSQCPQRATWRHAAPGGAISSPTTVGKCPCGLPVRSAAQPPHWQRCECAVAYKRVRNAKEKRPAGGFVPLPYVVIRSEQFARLSSHAVKLLVDLLAEY